MTTMNQEQEQSKSEEQEPAQTSSKACEEGEVQGINAYELRQAMKRERLENAASNARSASDDLFKRARDMSSAIPFGQPILVGHHSENRDRRYRGRINSTFERRLKQATEPKN